MGLEPRGRFSLFIVSGVLFRRPDMGEHSHGAVDVDPRELKKAQEMWDAFACGSKYAILAICGVLIALALTFIDFT